MLFLTTVKVFLSSVSFKALMVLKGFRNRERLDTKLRLRASASSPESAGTLSAVDREKSSAIVSRPFYLRLSRLSEWKGTLDLSNRKFDFVDGKYCSMPCHGYTFLLLRADGISSSIL